MPNKIACPLRVESNEELAPGYALITLSHPNGPGAFPPIAPGQFVQVQAPSAPGVLLRRPISINFFSAELGRLSLLVHAVGKGTRSICAVRPGDLLDCVLPLGQGFTLHTSGDILLVGGGVGTAPLLYLGAELRRQGANPVFLLGGRSRKDILQIPAFEQLGDVYFTTEDASLGERGFVTQHSVLRERTFQFISTCGPKPMMVAVARFATAAGIPCEASLENLMACGLGACLCCVENTREGNVCVCQQGPVFNINQLLWLD